MSYGFPKIRLTSDQKKFIIFGTIIILIISLIKKII